MELQRGSVPEYLYKYREGNDRDPETLTDRKIFVPDMDLLNDIFESEFQSEVELALEHYYVQPFGIHHNHHGDPVYTPFMMTNAVPEAHKEERRTAISREIAEARAEIRNLGVYSLSSTSTNPAMWGKYSNSFRGLCIEYKSTERNTNSPFFGPFEMTYEETPPMIEWALKDYYLGLRRFQLMSGFKSKEWEIEKEWRIFFKQKGLYQLPFKINSIIFGTNTKSDLKDKIREIFKDEVLYKKVIPKKGSYELEIISG